jgi:site-specific recombinase XerD
MPTVLAEYLFSRSKHRFPAAFVAPALQGGMLDYRKFHRELWKLCDLANVRRISPHELRHSCTEIWFRSGANLEDIRRLLNHKSVETTQRYVHRTDDRLASLAKAKLSLFKFPPIKSIPKKSKLSPSVGK